MMDAMPSDTDAAYLAGMIDGEGSIYLRTHRDSHNGWSLRLLVTNTHKPMLEHLHETWGGRPVRIHRSSSERARECFQWRCYGLDALVPLQSAAPFMIVKQPLALLGIRFLTEYRLGRWGAPTVPDELEAFRRGRDRVHDEMLDLNRQAGGWFRAR